MKDVIYNFINEHMMIHIVLIALCIAATIGAMFVDLVSGIMKAKQRGEARTSTGYKKTAIKAKKYFTPFIELCFIDLLCCVVIPFPVFQWFGRVTAFSVSLNQFVKNHGKKRSCAKQKRQWVWSSRTRMILPRSWLRYYLTTKIKRRIRNEVFTIAELCKSTTADRLGINNRCRQEHVTALTALVDNVLDPLRTWWESL